jgi:hypothetical protein
MVDVSEENKLKWCYICSLYYSIVLRAALYIILYYALQMEIGNAILLHMQIMLHIYIAPF